MVQGFTIRNGDRASGSGTFGGAIACFNASPRIAYNILTGNQADEGGAIFCDDGAAPVIVGNIITGNRADSPGAGSVAGGSSPHIALNTISENFAGYPFARFWRRDLLLPGTSPPPSSGNRILDNVANGPTSNSPAGAAASAASANSRGRSRRTRFSGNSADLGGGIYIIAEHPP